MHAMMQMLINDGAVEEADDLEEMFAQFAQLEEAERERNEGPNTYVQQLVRRRNEPIFKDAPFTVLQLCWLILMEKARSKVRDEAMNNILKLMSTLLAVIPGALFPTSLYAALRVVGANGANSSIEHLCPCCGDLFHHLSPDQYWQHVDDACRRCGPTEGRRFKQQSAHSTRAPVANKWYVDFGLPAVVRDCLFTNPTYCKLRTAPPCAPSESTPAPEGGFWESKEARRLDEWFGNRLIGNPNLCCLELGFDNGQVFTFKKWSTGFIVVRYGPPSLRRLLA